jgi:hypothetical protein
MPTCNARRVYTYLPTGDTTDLHPCIDYYRGAVFMDSGGYRSLLRNLAAHQPEQHEVSAGGTVLVCATRPAPPCVASKALHVKASRARG